MKKQFFPRLTLLAVTAACFGLLLGGAVLLFPLPLSRLCVAGVALLALLLGLAAAVSSWSARRVLQSMDKLTDSLDLDHPSGDDGIFPELIPFRDKLRQRQQTLLGRIDALSEDLDALRNIAGNMQKELHRQREEFASNISQLRPPLTAISGHGQQLGSGSIDPDQVQRLGAGIALEADRLIALTDDILRLSRIDDSAAVMTRVSLTSVCRESLTSLSLMAHRRGVGLKLTGPEVWVRGDPALLGELITCLCENAIQYNHPEGSVLVETAIDPDRRTVSVAVRDTGVGIPEEAFQHIFERFYRADNSPSDQSSNTGLGLAIAKRLADRHQGSISFESSLGQGSVFTVSFPAWQDEPSPASPAPTALSRS